MKINLLISTLLLPSMALYSQIIQPTRYNLDSLHIPTNKPDFKYIRLVENYDNQPNLFLFTEFTRGEKLIMRAISTKIEELKIEGPRVDYYENGNKKQESNYVNNKLNGTQISWYENGNKKLDGEYIEDSKNKTTLFKVNNFWNTEGVQKVTDGNGEYEESNMDKPESGKMKYYGYGTIKNGIKDGIWQGWTDKPEIKFIEEYKEGEFVSGKIIDENKVESTYNVLEKKPEHKKGIEKFYEYVHYSYRVPPEARDVSGKIYIKFIVDVDGKIINPTVIRDLGYGTGDEAIRILKGYKGFSPGEQRGRKVKVMYSLPITIQASQATKSARQIYNEQLQRSNDPFQANNNSFR